jgi:hypothetical protein
VSYLLKARTVEPEKQPLLANGSETTFVSRQRPLNNETTSAARQKILNKQEQKVAARERLGKHIPAEKVSIREWTVLSARAVPSRYKEDNWSNQVSSLREPVKKRCSWKGVLYSLQNYKPKCLFSLSHRVSHKWSPTACSARSPESLLGVWDLSFSWRWIFKRDVLLAVLQLHPYASVSEESTASIFHGLNYYRSVYRKLKHSEPTYHPRSFKLRRFSLYAGGCTPDKCCVYRKRVKRGTHWINIDHGGERARNEMAESKWRKESGTLRAQLDGHAQ